MDRQVCLRLLALALALVPVLVLSLGLGAPAAAAAAAADMPSRAKRSGFEFMSPQIQAMQTDETSNPGMFWVIDGERLWRQPQGSAAKSCATCHEDGVSSMRGVAARYPAFDVGSNRPIDLAGRINRCREKHQSAKPLALEGNELLGLVTYVAYQSRGMPIAPATDPRLASHRENGQRWFRRPLGQLQLSCASCHDVHSDGKLGGSAITQAHPTGYPLYRLEWQTVGSLQRRLRSCLVGVRAEPFEFGAPEYVDIELFLMSRAAGLAMETPAVRP